MAERVSLILRIMRNELAAERQRMKADIADVASLMAGAQLALKQTRALVLAPPSWPANGTPPSRSRAYVNSESTVPVWPRVRIETAAESANRIG
jgi:hypothetical protein